MSFKYRFILSFVLLEIVFILLIVTMNFITISNSSEQLIKQKLQSNISFLSQMLRLPISIYDLGSLDDLTNSTTQLEYINSIVVLDSQNKVLSSVFNFKYFNQKELLLIKDDQTINMPDHTYEIRYQKIKEENIDLGSFYVIFDSSESTRFINESKKNTIFIVLIEILISTYLSYFIGNRLTKVLTRLSEVAGDIGDNKKTEIPFQDRNDEIGILSRSMGQMLIDLKERRAKLQEFTKELKVQKNELVIANKSKDDFLANMSHELKTPLNSINVISSIMMKNTKKTLNEDQVKNLSIINNCGNDLLFLINDVLDVSKLEAGEITLVNETLYFKSVIDETKEMFNPQMKSKGIDFIVEYDDTIEYIYSDRQRIKQVIKNLLSNSVKFAQNGTIKLISKNEQDSVRVLVEDNGIGIPQSKLENIFDRFKQVDESTTRQYGGTGLGLAICKELTELLGGEISVQSEENKGTIFSITISKNSDLVDTKDVVVENILSIEDNVLEEVSTAPSIVEEDKNTLKLDNEVIKTSDSLLVLNNDPISFMKLSIELKKNYTIIQSNSLVNLLDDYKNNQETNLAIIDTSTLDKSNLEKIVTKLPIRFILIYSDELDSLENEKIIGKLKKPFNVEEIIAKIGIKENDEQI